MRPRARPLFLRTVFQILFRISLKNGKKGNPRRDIRLSFETRFRILRWIANLKPVRILKPKSRFPIERTH